MIALYMLPFCHLHTYTSHIAHRTIDSSMLHNASYLLLRIRGYQERVAGMDNCAFSTLQTFVNYGNIMSQMLANTSQCHLRHFETKQTFEKLNDQQQVNKCLRLCAVSPACIPSLPFVWLRNCCCAEHGQEERVLRRDAEVAGYNYRTACLSSG